MMLTAVNNDKDTHKDKYKDKERRKQRRRILVDNKYFKYLNKCNQMFTKCEPNVYRKLTKCLLNLNQMFTKS